MRKLILVALVAALGLMPFANPASAQPAQAVQTQASGRGPLYPLAVGAGAIAGVIIYNLATVGVSGAPLLARATTTGAMLTARAAAENRFYTISSAVVGAWLANWLYGN
jgi:hypothetical protein